MGDVNGRFSPLVTVEISISVIIEEEDEEDEEDKDKEGTSNKGGGGAGEANSWWTPLVLAVPRDRNVIPYRFGGVIVVVNGYWSINWDSLSSLKSNEDKDERPFVGGHRAWRQRQILFPHKRRVCGNVDEGIVLLGTTAIADVVVELDVDEHESVDFFV